MPLTQEGLPFQGRAPIARENSYIAAKAVAASRGVKTQLYLAYLRRVGQGERPPGGARVEAAAVEHLLDPERALHRRPRCGRRLIDRALRQAVHPLGHPPAGVARPFHPFIPDGDDGMTTTAHAPSLVSAREHLTRHCLECPVHQANVALSTLIIEEAPAAAAQPLTQRRRVKAKGGRTRTRRIARRPGKGRVMPKRGKATPTPSPSAPGLNAPRSHNDQAVLAALGAAPHGLNGRACADRAKVPRGSIAASLERLVGRGRIQREGRLYRLAKPAGGQAASATVAWAGRKDDPSLSSVGARKAAAPAGL